MGSQNEKCTPIEVESSKTRDIKSNPRNEAVFLGLDFVFPKENV